MDGLGLSAAAPGPGPGADPELGPWRVGLTGGVASGKSTVAAALVRLGAHLIDTDAIARRLTAPGGAALPALLAAFGPDCVSLETGLDRHRMRARAFAEPGLRQQLEALLHPLIQQAAERQASAALQAPHRPAWLLFDVPLLTERPHWRQRVQRVLLIDCDERVQAARAAQRPGWDAAQAAAVMAAQSPRAARRSCADAVIDNSHLSLDELAKKVRAIACRWGLKGQQLQQGMEESRG